MGKVCCLLLVRTGCIWPHTRAQPRGHGNRASGPAAAVTVTSNRHSPAEPPSAAAKDKWWRHMKLIHGPEAAAGACRALDPSRLELEVKGAA